MSFTLARNAAAVPAYDARDLSDDGIEIRLHRNESALPAPEFVVDAVRGIDGETLRTYPTALQRSVIERLAARALRDPSRIVLANGADELLAACARAVLDPGDGALTVAPTFGMYARVVALAGGSLRRVPYARRWRMDPLDIIKAANERTKLVILGNPNNPTGDALRIADLTTIARALPQALILVDEVYLSLSQRSLVATAPAQFDNVAILGSFSKSVAMAGARLGWIAAPAPLAAALARSLGPYPVSALTLVAADAYLREPAQTRAFESALEAQNARSLDAFEAALAAYASDVWRGAANFLLADCGERAVLAARPALRARHRGAHLRRSDAGRYAAHVRGRRHGDRRRRHRAARTQRLAGELCVAPSEPARPKRPRSACEPISISPARSGSRRRI